MAHVDHLSCRECRAAHAAYVGTEYEQEPPCATCHPGVHRYNVPAYTLWPLVKDQVLTVARGNDGVTTATALSLPAVESALNIAQVDQDSRLEIACDLLTMAGAALTAVNSG